MLPSDWMTVLVCLWIGQRELPGSPDLTRTALTYGIRLTSHGE